MDIQFNSNTNKHPKVYDEDIQYYGRQLLAMVTAYRQHIYIKTDEQLKALNELEYYAQMILSRNYDMIMTNSSEVITQPDPNYKPDDEYPF